jgi:hypothetical protein
MAAPTLPERQLTPSFGASEPPNSVALQPSAAIFDLTTLVAGAMILAGAWFAYRALARRAMLIPTVLLGVGTPGVGVFPLTHLAPHTLFAFTAFLAGGIAVVLSSRVTTAPSRYLWTTLGAIALGATVLALDAFRGWAPMVELGEGASSGGSCTRRPVASGLRQLPAGDCQPDRHWEPRRHGTAGIAGDWRDPSGSGAGRPRSRWSCWRLTYRGGCMPNRRQENRSNPTPRGAPWP